MQLLQSILDRTEIEAVGCLHCKHSWAPCDLEGALSWQVCWELQLQEVWPRQTGIYIPSIDVVELFRQICSTTVDNKAEPTSALGSGSAAGAARLPGFADLGFAADAMLSYFAVTGYCRLVVLDGLGRLHWYH
jgi:hypothetical protein